MEARFLSTRFTRRTFLAGLGATAALPILAACQPQTVEVEVTREVEKVVEVEVEKVVEVEVEKIVEVEVEKVVTPMMKEPTEIRFSTWWGDFWKAYSPMVEEKTNTKALYEFTPWAQYHDKLILQLASGDAPDVPMWSGHLAGTFFPTGTLASLDDYLKAVNFDADKWYWDPWQAGGYQGKVYALDTYIAHPVVFHVNTTLTDELGLTDQLPVWDSPMYDEWHWDDLLAFIDQIEEARAGGETDAWPVGFGLSWGYGSKMPVFSNNAVSYDTTPNWDFEESKCLLDSPEAIEVFEAFVNLHLNKQTPTAADQKAVPGGLFRAGKLVMTSGPVGITAIPSATVDFDMTEIFLPWWKQRTMHVGQDYHSVHAKSKVLDAAYDYAYTQVTDGEVGIKFVLATGLAQPFNAISTMQSLPDSFYGKTTSAIQTSRWAPASLVPEKSEAFHYPIHDGAKAPEFLVKTISTALQSAGLGKQPTDVAIKEAVAKINAELDTKN